MLRLPSLSPDAAAYVESIVGHKNGSIDLTALTPDNLDVLLVVIEAEIEHLPAAVIGGAVEGDLNALLTQIRRQIAEPGSRSMREDASDRSFDMAHSPSRGAEVSLTFLILDDDEESRFLLRRDLSREYPGAKFVECRSVEEAIAATTRQHFSAVITDHNLCGATGCEAIARMRARGHDCPIVMVTGSIDPKVSQAAMAAGASRVFRSGDPELMAFLRTAIASQASD